MPLNEYEFPTSKLSNVQSQLERLVEKNYYLHQSAKEAFRWARARARTGAVPWAAARRPAALQLGCRLPATPLAPAHLARRSNHAGPTSWPTTRTT